MSWRNILKDDKEFEYERYVLFPNGEPLPLMNRWLKIPQGDNTEILAEIVNNGHFIDKYTNTTYHVKNKEIVSINQE
jgi:hypothetical protein